jgi:hypothetical protein
MLGLDDIPWSVAPLSPADLEELLDSLSDRIASANSRNELLSAHESLYELPRVADKTLANVLFDRSDISTTVRLRAQKLIDRIPTFPDGDLPLEVAWAGQIWLAPTTSWVCQRRQNGDSAACVTAITAGRRLQTSVSAAGLVSPVWFISDEQSHVDYFRHLATQPHCHENDFAALAPHAFPNLVFVDGVFRGLRDLSCPFAHRRDDVVRTLGALSDYSEIIFASHKEKDIAGQLRALGIDASTETRETLEDAKCRTARERRFGSQVLLFDWHAKFEPQVDRLHFCPPMPSSGNKPIIGIIHRHLPLPGDR